MRNDFKLIYAVGDIHGMHDHLVRMLEKIKVHAGDRPHLTVFLGDYCDRGPKTYDVMQTLKTLDPETHAFLIGNHEVMWKESYQWEEMYSSWILNGGNTTEASYRDAADERHDDLNPHQLALEDLKWIFDNGSYMLETENHVFVHAGLFYGDSLSEQKEKNLLWIRHWEDEEFDYGKHVVYGHTPRRGVKAMKHSTGLDTCAFGYGNLTCGVFDRDVNGGPIQYLQVNGPTAPGW